MLYDLILLILFTGLPWYPLLRRKRSVKREHIFLLSALSVLIGLLLSSLTGDIVREPFVALALLFSLFVLYSTLKTNNLYKLGTQILFFNAPLLLLVEPHARLLYGVSLLLSLAGIYMMAKYYERVYSSANYYSVTGITLVTPYAALFLTIYFTALALYPPFPNAIFFLEGILHATVDPLWYLVTIVIFFGNFLIAVRVMARTVFGKPNPNIHYIDVTPKERRLHLLILIIFIALSLKGLQEVLA